MPSAPCQGGDRSAVDHISDLTDDLLLHVLRFLSDDARDVVCTSVLSKRWRNLWTLAPVLRLRNWNRNGQSVKENNEQFNDFVHNVLARRASVGADADIDTLVLRTRLWPGKSRANLWLRRAMAHTVTFMTFQVSKPSWKLKMSEDEEENEELLTQLDLPTTTRLTTMWLELDHAILQLPPEVDFHALTELTLYRIKFSGDDDLQLGRLLSSPSCCPRLRKLTLSNLSEIEELRLDGGALEILHLERLSVRWLDVDAPRLSALDVGNYFMFSRFDGNSSIHVRAPALKNLVASLALGYMQLELQRHTIQLLQQCRPVDGHTLWLYVPQKLTRREEDEPMIEIPHLPGVIDLTLEYDSDNSHYLGAMVTSLLARCSNLEYLHLDNLIHQRYRTGCKEGCDDCRHRGSWKDNVISLEHLRKVKLCGFSGQEHYCHDMVQLLLMSAPALERMIVTAKTFVEYSSCTKLMLAESLESFLPQGRGNWTAVRAANAMVTSEYVWMPHPEMLATKEGDASFY